MVSGWVDWISRLHRFTAAWKAFSAAGVHGVLAPSLFMSSL